MQKVKQIFLWSVFILLSSGISINAQENVTILSSNIEAVFGETITASLAAESETEIVNVEFFYRPLTNRTPLTKRNVAEFEPGTDIEATYVIDQQITYLPPGTTLEYWWKLTDVNDNALKTERESYLHLDDRYDFQSLSNERITLYWYRGSDDFGQALFDQANQALTQLEDDFGASLNQAVQVFIYNGGRDLRDALGPGSNEWTGGVAYANYGVIAMGVAPSSLQWGLQATTHELAHLVIHQVTANPYGDIPRWLDEGLAVYSEDPDQLDAQFRLSLQEAIDNNQVMTLQTLSSSFPADAQEANLAYGQSRAVVDFIIDTYGKEAIAELLTIFSEGELYDRALEQALGLDTWELDAQWRESLGLPPLDNRPIEIVPTPDLSLNDLPCATAFLPLVLMGVLIVQRRPKRVGRFVGPEKD